MTLAEDYQSRLARPQVDDDIWEHLPTLKHYAELVGHITEFGVRTGNSTCAFLAGLSRHGGIFNSYDISKQQYFPPIHPNVIWQYHQVDITKLDRIAPTDLLFLDSCHQYEHVLSELMRFSQFSKEYIIMHDTSSVWVGGDAVWRARNDFLLSHPEWFISSHYDNCNGLSILERT